MTEIVTSGSMSGERKRDHGQPTRARSWKRRKQPRKAHPYRAAPQLYPFGNRRRRAHWTRLVSLLVEDPADDGLRVVLELLRPTRAELRWDESPALLVGCSHLRRR